MGVRLRSRRPREGLQNCAVVGSDHCMACVGGKNEMHADWV